jgi:hypothetical protein
MANSKGRPALMGYFLALWSALGLASLPFVASND